MKRHFAAILFLVGLSCAFTAPVRAGGQVEHHGADSVFRVEGLSVLWAVLKGDDEATSQVCIQIVTTSERFRFFSVLAVDPFTSQVEALVEGRGMQKENLVRSSRTSFQDKTGRRMLFFETEKNLNDGRPDLVIHYFGVPDTAPELISEQNLREYFRTAAARP